jgi:predicted Na+-dependent transporter
VSRQAGGLPAANPRSEPAIRQAKDLLERILLALVVAVALAGWAAPGPGRLLERHQAINAMLAVLVFASGMTVPAGVVSRVRALAPRLAVVVITAAAALPLLAFALSRLLGPAALRDGVLAVGVAPAEVASVAITGIAGGEVGAAAVLLVASTLICVVVAGPILSVVGGHGVSGVHVLVTLTLVVGLPLLAGLLLKRLMTADDRVDDGFQALAIIAVVVLVWLVSAQVRLSAAYGTLVAVLVALIAASAAIGLLLSWRLAPAARTGVVLNVSMRDFAVASGIAAAAFGPATAAPLGIYGVLVMAWGALVARMVRRRGR